MRTACIAAVNLVFSHFLSKETRILIATIARQKNTTSDLIDFGYQYEQRHQFDNAEQCYEEALATLESVAGSSKELLAQTLRNLARVCKIQGKLAEAILLEDRAERLDGGESRPLGGSGGFWALLGGMQ